MSEPIRTRESHQDISEKIARIRYYAFLRKNPSISPEALGEKTGEIFEVGLQDKEHVSTYFPSLDAGSCWAELGYLHGLNRFDDFGSCVVCNARDQRNYNVGFRVGRIEKTSEIEINLP